jgi:two-component system alkaline phosphatase synthesis response regulator PhoP
MGVSMKKKTILVAEDDINISELVEYNLEQNGYNVLKATNGQVAIEKLNSYEIDLAILDIMLPIVDGLGILSNIRNDVAKKNIPVIMLTAKSSEVDKIVGFELGADDYLTKPFLVSELMSRVKAHLRREDRSKAQTVSSKMIRIGDLSIDFEKYEVIKDDRQIKLSLKEFELLKFLIENRGRVLTRDQLLDEIWGYEYFGETRTVDVHIRHLRRKLDEDENNSIIETIRGVGYKIK